MKGEAHLTLIVTIAAYIAFAVAVGKLLAYASRHDSDEVEAVPTAGPSAGAIPARSDSPPPAATRRPAAEKGRVEEELVHHS